MQQTKQERWTLEEVAKFKVPSLMLDKLADGVWRSVCDVELESADYDKKNKLVS